MSNHGGHFLKANINCDIFDILRLIFVQSPGNSVASLKLLHESNQLQLIYGGNEY